ncbi:hypothetical protein BDP27DRAFT_1372670 [Rhodocollybia butyracea]|uniref:Uncharacterized protein n=1 Tax=Rhodocollybia butyracea TaxID=206335 RepID=A0A9P5TYI2_9AGAR|nr:hypothetical protein BDP27DRAFT_1372670 [Rhodocollybia butyracea]
MTRLKTMWMAFCYQQLGRTVGGAKLHHPLAFKILVIGNEPGNFESFTSYNRRRYGSGAAAAIDDSTTNEELRSCTDFRPSCLLYPLNFTAAEGNLYAAPALVGDILVWKLLPQPTPTPTTSFTKSEWRDGVLETEISPPKGSGIRKDSGSETQLSSLYVLRTLSSPASPPYSRPFIMGSIPLRPPSYTYLSTSFSPPKKTISLMDALFNPNVILALFPTTSTSSTVNAVSYLKIPFTPKPADQTRKPNL